MPFCLNRLSSPEFLMKRWRHHAQLGQQRKSCLVRSNRGLPILRFHYFSTTGLQTTSKTPIAVIGGGPSGLLLSNLLSHYQVPFVLLESQSVEQRCSHPQAHFLNTRSMEILRQLSKINHRLHAEMTPVHQWNHFQFGYNMLPQTSLARVLHPVDRPLEANVDANGILVDDDNNNNNDNHHHSSNRRQLSACSVGHLAQHTFCRILYNAAQGAAQEIEKTQLLYSTKVQELEAVEDGTFDIHTTQGSKINADICVAADGAHSFCRSNWDIELRGKVGIQHLLNIHVKTNPDWAWRELHDEGRNFAMLYSVFHPNVVAMIVCHSVGEYVFQVPFFPPYQDLEDYNHDCVAGMVRDVMGISNDNDEKNNGLEIVSVKAWTMSSLIADDYYYQSSATKSTGFLIGDAAHVFPPAGGLGMNTGMQDVYTLAWKLAWAYHNDKLHDKELMKQIGQRYTQERRSVALYNAALSVRNYHRLLGITKACYLHEQHPELLIKTLEASSPLVPFAARRTLFQRLFSTATWTLSSLKDLSHPYTQHLRNNIRNILAQGGGLPLLFPNAELGFGYHQAETPKNEQASSRDSNEDTMGFTPEIITGCLFPHVSASIVGPSNPQEVYPNLKPLESGGTLSSSVTTTISTSDLPAQVSRDSKPCFVLAVIGVEKHTYREHHQSVQKNVKNLAGRLGMQVEVVEILPAGSSADHDGAVIANKERKTNLILTEEHHPTEGCLLDQYRNSVWLIRPDGHVAGGLTGLDSATALQDSQLVDTLLKYAEQSIF